MELQRASVILSLVLWPAELVLCALALARRAWRLLPCFTVYVVALVIAGTARWMVIVASGEQSQAYSLTYWLSQPVLILTRFTVLADICRAALRPYSGIWRLAKPLLLITATLLLGLAAARTTGGHRMISYILFAEREMEFAIVLTLLALLLLSRYIGVALDRPMNGIALGIGLHSSYIIVMYTIILQQFQVPQWAVSIAGSVAFTTAVVIWLHALWQPLPVLAQPELSSAESYEQDTLAVSGRMRELNDRLSRLRKR